jgi:hypothetical protein
VKLLRWTLFTLVLAVVLLPANSVGASNWAQTSVGLTPLSDLGQAMYGGFQGGLYKTDPTSHSWLLAQPRASGQSTVSGSRVW